MPPELEKKLDEMVEANVKQWIEDKRAQNEEAFAAALENSDEE